MRLRAMIVLTLLTGAGLALYIYFEKQAKLLRDYVIKPIAAKIIAATKDTLVIDFTVRFTNKSAIEATIVNMYTDIYLNGVYAGQAQSQGQSLIPGNGESDIKVRLTAVPKEVLKNIVGLLSVLATNSDIPYEIKGYAKVKSGFLAVNVPFDQTGGLKQDLLT